jgi:hypothetical protein
MVRATHADPADPGFARERNRGVRGAAHHEMAHAVVAVDQRRRRSGLGDGDIRLGVEAAGADAADILRQAEDAMRIGAGEVRLGHQLRDLVGIGGRKPDGTEHVGDEGRDGVRSEPAVRVLLAGAVVHQRASDAGKQIMCGLVLQAKFSVSSPSLTGRSSNHRTLGGARSLPHRSRRGYWIARSSRAMTAS